MSVQYWRMQLHPDSATFSSFYAYTSIAKGFIGLDFKKESNAGDLLRLQDDDSLGYQKSYLPFAREMNIGDIVLIISHHNPIAVVKITSEYNYIRQVIPELGIWFRHFRQIDKDNIIYYSDFETNKNNYVSIKMTNTISPLRNDDTQSIQLIHEMIEWEKSHNPNSIY